MDFCCCPRAQEPKSPRAQSALALGELEPLAGAGTTRLLPLYFTGIAREHPFAAQGRAELAIVAHQGPRERQPNRARLTGLAAAVHIHLDVESAQHVHRAQRLLRMLLVREPREVLVQRAAVHFPVARARTQPHSRHTRLAAAYSMKTFSRCHAQNSSFSGCCASWGWFGPAYTFSFRRIS